MNIFLDIHICTVTYNLAHNCPSVYNLIMLTFCKRDVFYYHYAISYYHSNELPSVISFKSLSYVACHEGASGVLFKSIMYIL
jgi:hypothetical protein